MAQALRIPTRQPQQALESLADLRALEDRLDWKENQPAAGGGRVSVAMWVLTTLFSAAAAATSMVAWHTMHRGG